MLGHRPLRIPDYLGILKRRGWMVLVPLIFVPLLAVAYSYTIPPQYLSRTLVLIESQRVADNIVKPVISTDIDSRLASMKEQILSRTSMQPIIDRYNLYADTGMSMDERIDKARKNVEIKPITPEVAHSSGLPGFEISFKASDPHVAQQVCTEITSQFVGENLKARSESAEGTVSFLDSQLSDAKRSLDEQEAKLAAFEQKYIGRLPGQEDTNSSMLTTLSTQLESSNQQLSRMQQDKALAESLLAQQQGQSAPALSATTGARTPAVAAGPTEQQSEQMRLLEAQRSELLSHYTPDYPDVQSVERQIASLRREIAHNAAPARAGSAAPVSRPPTAAVLQLQAQIKSADIGIQAKKQEQAQIESAIANYKSRIDSSPKVELEYKQLTRDHDQAQLFYNELLAKINTAKMATDLEKRQEGEHFRVQDAANLPDAPFSPKRSAFLFGGLAGGFLIGLAFVSFREFKDTAMRDAHDIQYFLNLPTLTTLAYSDEVSRIKRPGALFRFFFQRAPRTQPMGKNG